MRDISEKVRVFIGTEPKTEIARKVLACSIQRRTETAVEVVPMIGPKWEYSTSGFHFGTGFSLRRWMIPAYCNWQGKAIYLDADQLVLGDIQELWQMPDLYRSRPSVWCTYQPDVFSKTPWAQSSVMVIDCERAKDEWGWRLDEAIKYLRGCRSRKDYAAFMHCMTRRDAGLSFWTNEPPQQIPTAWNSLDAFAVGQTKLIHYTSEPAQPWYNPNHAHADLWQKELTLAMAEGLVTDDEVEAALAEWSPPGDNRRMTGMHPAYQRFVDRRRQKKAHLRQEVKNVSKYFGRAGRPPTSFYDNDA